MECAGPVRHFCVTRLVGVETLVAGTCKPAHSLQTFQRTAAEDDSSSSERYTLVGNAEVGVNVFCVLPAAKVDATAEADGITAVSAASAEA